MSCCNTVIVYPKSFICTLIALQKRYPAEKLFIFFLLLILPSARYNSLENLFFFYCAQSCAEEFTGGVSGTDFRNNFMMKIF